VAQTLIDKQRIKTSVLADAAHDYVGLYEVVWDLNTQYPTETEDAKLNAARTIVRELFNTGVVELYRSIDWPPTSYERVEHPEAESLLGLSTSYQLPDREKETTIYWLAACDERNA
jgi:hypothetical protein